MGVALLTSLGILLVKSFIGHSATADGKSMAIAMNFLHQASSFIWLGGLLSLVFLLPAAARTAHAGQPTQLANSINPDRSANPNRPTNTAQAFRNKPSSSNVLYWEAIRRFSILAASCVIILLVSGIYGSLLYVPTWHALLNSSYGLILLAKAGLTLVMLLLGLSAFLRGRRQSRPLGPGVWIEFSIGLIVLVLAALLSNMPTAVSSPGPIELKGTTTDGYKLTINVSPNIVGQNTFEVTVHDRDDKPLNDIEQITLTMTSMEMDMGTIEIILPKGDASTLIGKGLVTMGGSWNLNVHILLSSLDTIDGRFTFQVGNQ
ncbi:Copper transport protein YcnJ precursor [compost metagenome]